MSKILKKLAATIFAIGLLLLAVDNLPPSKDRFDTHLVRIQMGDHSFSFPRNYLWKYKQQTEKDGDGYIHIRILLPKFEPMKSDNYERFKKFGSDIDLAISLDKNSDKKPSNKFQLDLAKDFERLSNIYCASEIRLLKSESRDDLEVYSCEPRKKLYTTLNRDFFIVCSDKADWPNPQCQSMGNTYDLYGNLGFAFHFDAAYASKSYEIYHFVRELIETAKINGEK